MSRWTIGGSAVSLATQPNALKLRKWVRFPHGTFQKEINMFNPDAELKRIFHLVLVSGIIALYAMFYPLHALITFILMACMVFIFRK